MAGDSARTGSAVLKKPRIIFLMNEILVFINNEANIYQWKLVGDSPECIPKLIECKDENIMNHILDFVACTASRRNNTQKV
jgi:hypothetical protein